MNSTYNNLDAAFSALGADAFREAVLAGEVLVVGTTIHAGRRTPKTAPVLVEKWGRPGTPKGSFWSPADHDVDFKMERVTVGKMT